VKNKQKHIAIFPLNWGLGHAARCIPIIQHLINAKHKVSLAAEKNIIDYLHAFFQQEIDFYEIPQFKVKYAKTKLGTQWQIFRTACAYLFNFRKTHQAYQKCIKKMPELDLIISDNVYACYDKTIPSVIITHQLKLRLAYFLQWLAFLPNHLLRKKLKNFKEVWIPDFADNNKNLSGSLSHPLPKTINAKYIGILSRFTKEEKLEKKNNILVILSGPEPQKTIFEKELLQELSVLSNYEITVIGGNTKEELPNIRFIPFIDCMKISDYINKAEIIISRAGYSSIMDYIRLEKKAIMLPTAGQSEQEYLSKKLQYIPQFIFQQQNQLNLKQAIKQLQEQKVFIAFEEEASFISFLEAYL
jgi:uncharacterized protein (TIGR00661 family)